MTINKQLEELGSEHCQSAIDNAIPFDRIRHLFFQELGGLDQNLRSNTNLNIRCENIAKTATSLATLSINLLGMARRIQKEYENKEHSQGYPMDWGCSAQFNTILGNLAGHHLKRLSNKVNIYDSMEIFLADILKIKSGYSDEFTDKFKKKLYKFFENQFVMCGVLNPDYEVLERLFK